jgi:hypothetical protein
MGSVDVVFEQAPLKYSQGAKREECRIVAQVFIGIYGFNIKVKPYRKGSVEFKMKKERSWVGNIRYNSPLYIILVSKYPFF